MNPSFRTPLHLLCDLDRDQQTENDADRIRRNRCAGNFKVNTGKGCHLDAQMKLVMHYGELQPQNSLMFY